MLVVYPLPDKGISISDMAWEWTVCFVSGVWRCLVKINKKSFHAFVFQPLNVKSGMEATVFQTCACHSDALLEC